MGVARWVLANHHLSPPPQVLLTDQDLMNHRSQSDLITTLKSLLDMRMIPILNGNDAVAADDSTKNVMMLSSDLMSSDEQVLFSRWYQTTTSSLLRWLKPLRLTSWCCCLTLMGSTLVILGSPSHASSPPTTLARPTGCASGPNHLLEEEEWRAR